MLMKRFLLLLGSLLALLAAWPEQAAADVAGSQLNGLVWLIKNQKRDGSWPAPPGLETITTATAVEAMLNAGLKGVYLDAAVSWLGTAPAPSTDALARKIAALTRAGQDTSLLQNRLVSWNIFDTYNGTGYGWGTYDQFAISFLDSGIASIALAKSGNLVQTLANGPMWSALGNNVCSISNVPDRLRDAQGRSSWPYARNDDPLNDLPSGLSPALYKDGDLLPTAYTLYALVLARGGSYSCGSVLTTAVNEGIAWLLATRQSSGDGGFGDPVGGVIRSSPLVTAVVYQALAAYCAPGGCPAATVAARDRALTYLLQSQNPNSGDWGVSALTTATVLQALPAVTLADSDGDGIPDALENALGGKAGVGDRLFAANSGTGSGIAAPAPLGARIVVNTSYSQTLAPRGGTPPYTWTLLSGALPPGLAGLSGGNGGIVGMPTTLGAYPFTYRVSDSSGSTTTVANRIEVVVPVAGPTALQIKIDAKRFYTTTLTPLAGTSPFVWTLVSGALPPGLSGLSGSNASISGAPTTPGSYAFSYTVTDALNSSATVVNQIVVVPSLGALMSVLLPLLLDD